MHYLVYLIALVAADASTFYDYPIVSHELQVQTDSSEFATLAVGQKMFLVVNLDNTLARQMNFTYVTEGN